MKASKLTARGLAYAFRAVGRKIAKAHREAQTPHGKQSVKKLMAHGTATNSIEVDAPKVFDRVARKWNVDYAFYKTGPDKYLLFFKSGQADAMTACFSEYSRKVLDKSKSRRVPIREQLKRAADQLAKEKPRQKERVKEAAHADRYAVYSPSRWRDMGLTRSPANYPQTGLKFLSYTLPASTRV